MSDIEIAVEALKEKGDYYQKLWNYYDGNQPLIYSTDRLQEVFSTIKARFTQNWCGVVVDSVLERMEFKQFQTNSDAATNVMNMWWVDSGLELDADDVELCALVTGESFVIVWPEDGGLQAYYNDSRMVYAQYDTEMPRKMRFAAKWWEAGDQTNLTLYYSDRIEYYAAPKELTKVAGPQDFGPRLLDEADQNSWYADNPLNIIPVFHFRRERRALKSELGPSVLDMQDAVNKLLNDMMVASEFGAFKQRYIISQADVGQLKNAPNEIWDLPAGDGLGQGTEVGEFQETNLDNFMSQIEALATGIAKMTRTPQYYFFLGARADPSGETLYAMDGPLIKKTESYIKRFRREWERLGRFVAGYLGIGAEQVRVIYADPRTLQPKTEAETRQANVNAGIPLVTQLRQEGWTPQELAQLEADKSAQQEAQTQMLATALLNQQRQLDQGVNDGESGA